MLNRTRLAAAMLWLGMPTAALACGYHVNIGNGLSLMHPGSLTVAVAMRRAADAGLIDVDAAETYSQKSAQLFDATLKLYALKAALASAIPEQGPPFAFSVGFVESGLWTRFRVVDGTINMALHTDGARDGEATVLTGKSVLAKMLSGELSVEHALAADLLAIEGDALGRVHRALAAAFGPGLRASR